jgi:hypothetical protein
VGVKDLRERSNHRFIMANVDEQSTPPAGPCSG